MSGQWSGIRVSRCRIEGCEAVVPDGGGVCGRCQEEMEALTKCRAGRCDACRQPARGELCAECMRALALIADDHRLGRKRRHGDTVEAKQLHRWLRRQEWRERLRGAVAVARGFGLWLLQVLVVWTLGYEVTMFLAWALGWR